jgi:hypothetical protein
VPPEGGHLGVGAHTNRIEKEIRGDDCKDKMSGYMVLLGKIPTIFKSVILVNP